MDLNLGYAVALALVTSAAGAAPVTIDGAQTYQVIDGFGVNANHRSWTNNELQMVLDALIDQAGMTLFHVIFDNNNWEATNDNSNASVMNWDYYNTVYSAPEFQKLWGIMAYLNQRGITNGLVPSFEGPVALWMGGLSLTPGYENEYAETITSLLLYARNTQHLQFSMVEPVNEPDITYTGIHLTGASQFVTVMHDLAQQLDANGMGDLRFSGPDLSNTSTAWLSAMMTDPVVMAKLAHFGLHSYLGSTPDATGVYNFIQQSVYTNLHFWMTEFNVWCQSCAYSGVGDNSWAYARGTATCLLNHLAKGASAGLVWEGYDSQLTDFNATTGGNNPPHWSCWGLFAVDDPNAVTKTYTPRKGFYTVAQIAKFVRPGAQQIDVSGSTARLTLLAFYNTNSGQLTLTGANTNSSAASLSCALTSLPAIPSLDLYYTSSTTNLCYGGSVSLTNGTFSVVVPADCVFTLASANHAPSLSPVSVSPINAGQTITITNNASHLDSPPQTLTFGLLTAPEGATLDPTTGVFIWRAPVALANTTNPVALAVTDNGYPPLSATQSFSLVVNPVPPPTFQKFANSNGHPTLRISGPIGPDYLLQRSSDLTVWSTIYTSTPLVVPFDLTDTNVPFFPPAFYRILLAP
jgi:O-glycosyl hydrolase